jgi:hypothetical protein
MPQRNLAPQTRRFYRDVLLDLERAGLPFLVGGAYALEHYTGVVRDTKDLDLFVRRADVETVLARLERGGWQTELTFPHWLGKAYKGDDFVDLIFSSGNGLAEVDERWFEHAERAAVLDLDVALVPPEEMRLCSRN